MPGVHQTYILTDTHIKKSPYSFYNKDKKLILDVKYNNLTQCGLLAEIDCYFLPILI